MKNTRVKNGVVVLEGYTTADRVIQFLETSNPIVPQLQGLEYAFELTQWEGASCDPVLEACFQDGSVLEISNELETHYQRSITVRPNYDA